MSEYGHGAAPLFEQGGSARSDLMTTLEQRLGGLVERHRSARRSIDELGAQLAERDRRIAELEAQRARAAARVERLLERVEALERRSAAS